LEKKNWPTSEGGVGLPIKTKIKLPQTRDRGMKEINRNIGVAKKG